MISVVCAKFSFTDKAWVAFFDTLTGLLKKAELDGEFKCYLKHQEQHKVDSRARNSFSVLRRRTQPNMVRVSFYHGETGIFRTYNVEWRTLSTGTMYKNQLFRDHIISAERKPQ